MSKPKTVGIKMSEQAWELFDMMAESFEMNRTQFMIDMLKQRGCIFADIEADPDFLSLESIYYAVKKEYDFKVLEDDYNRISHSEILRRKIGEPAFAEMLVEAGTDLETYEEEKTTVFNKYRGESNE